MAHVMKEITREEFTRRRDQGELLMLAEYRGSKAEDKEWKNKTGPGMVKGVFLTHSIEVGATQIAVAERTADGFVAEGYQWPFPKGTPIVWFLESLEVNLGLYKGRGTIAKLVEGKK